MRARNWILTLLLTLAAFAGSSAQDFSGTHTGEQSSVEPGERYTLVRTLRIDRNGNAELTSQYRGDRPSVTKRAVDAFGWLLGDIARESLIRHRGTWREDRGRLRLSLRSIQAGSQTYSTNSEFLFEIQRSQLIAVDQDREHYGQQNLRLNFSGSGGGQSGSVVGTYEVRQDSRDRANEFTLIRTLRLDSNGTASLEWWYQGDEPNVSRNNLRLYGEILADMTPVRRITHSGRWSQNRNEIRIDLDRLGSRDRVSSTLRFDLRGRDLVFDSWDRENYGSERLTFRPGSSGGSGGRPPTDAWSPVEGSYTMNFTLESTAEITRTLILRSGGQAVLETEYPSNRRTQVTPTDQRKFGEPILRLGTQRVFVMEGSWTRSGSQVTVSFTRLDGTSYRATMRLESRDGSILAVSADSKAFGTTLIKFRRR